MLSGLKGEITIYGIDNFSIMFVTATSTLLIKKYRGVHVEMSIRVTANK